MARAIDQFLAAIRQAIYGKDVREAIASGIEQCYNDSTASAQKAEIEAKGEEVLASIPEDYSALTAEVEDIKAVNKIFNRDVVGVPNLIDTATWIDNANLNDSGATNAAQGWKVTEGYIETSADSYKISYNNSETMYIVQVAGYTSNGSFVRMFANADSSSGVRSFIINTTSVDKIRIATRYGNPILSVYPNDGKIVEKLASVEDDVSDLKSAIDDIAGKRISMTGHTLFLDGPISGATIKSVTEEAKSSFVLSVSHGNMMPWPYYRTSPYTTKGVTFVINDDGTITANGTASADVAYTVGYMATNYPSYYRENNGTPQYGYYLSGCTDGADDTYYLLATNSGIKCKTKPVPVFTANGAVINIQIVVKSGVTLSNKKFYPMLSPTADTEYSAPVAYQNVSLNPSADEYTWDDVSIPEGPCVIASNAKTTLTLTTDAYDTIASVRRELDALEERVPENHWKDKKWVAFGTSITDNYSQNSYITQGEHTGEHTGKYVPYLLDMSELSSSAFVNRGISGGSINGHILYYIRYYTSDQANADLITIEGAVNDFATSVPLGQVGDTVPYTNSLLPDSTAEGTFAGACYQAFTTALTNAPNAVVVLLTETTGKNHVGYANYYQLRKNDLGLYQSDYIEMTMKVAEFVGIPVINCGRDSMINAENPQYIADHIHHTYLGGYQYARTIWAKLKGIPLKVLTVPE